MAIGIRRHGGRALAEINVTPLVDVVLVLLIIFMLTAPILQSGIEVSVPKTKSVNEITEERIVISITRAQRVFLGNDAVKSSGITNVSIVTEPLKENASTR